MTLLQPSSCEVPRGASFAAQSHNDRVFVAPPHSICISHPVVAERIVRTAPPSADRDIERSAGSPDETSLHICRPISGRIRLLVVRIACIFFHRVLLLHCARSYHERIFRTGRPPLCMRRASSSSSDIAGSTDDPFQEKWLLLVDEMKEEWAKVGGISMGIVEVVITVATLQFHAGARSPFLFTFGALTTVCGLIGTVLSFYHTTHAYILSNLNIEKMRAELDTSLNRPYLLALPVLCACPRAFFIWTLLFFGCSTASLAWSLTLDLKPSSGPSTPGPNQDPPPLPLIVSIVVSVISVVFAAFAALVIVCFGSLVDAQPCEPEEPPRDLLNMAPLSTPRPRLAPLCTEDLKAGYNRGGPMTA